MSEKIKIALVIADSREAIEELTSGAASMAETVYLAYMGQPEDALNARTAYRFDPESESFANCVGDIAVLVEELGAELVLCAPSRNGRLAAAVTAARNGVCVLTDCTGLKLENGCVESTRMVYGGMAVKTERSLGKIAVICPSEGIFETKDAVPAEKIVDCKAGSGIRLIERRSKQLRKKSITAAKNIVGVGRGLEKAENLPLAMDLAKAIEGEVGCTRPVAEENQWLPRECNIGISGATVKPNLYIACGISGQIQHLVGINESRVIAAINRDKNAPIFSACDIGIVGDVTAIIPKLLKKFGQA